MAAYSLHNSSELGGDGHALAVLFDMDGTVVDTEPLWFDAEAAYVAQYGREWTAADALEVVGTSGPYATARMRQKAGSTDSHEVIFSFIMGRMLASIAEGKVDVRPGILELIDQLHAAGIATALVTSSVREMSEAILQQLPAGAFDTVVCFDDVVHHKPDPEPYVAAMQNLGVSPQNCVVIEDSSAGVASGLAAGANVVAVPCMLEIPAQSGLSRVASAEDLTLDRISKIARGAVIDDLERTWRTA